MDRETPVWQFPKLFPIQKYCVADLDTETVSRLFDTSNVSLLKGKSVFYTLDTQKMQGAYIQPSYSTTLKKCVFKTDTEPKMGLDPVSTDTVSRYSTALYKSAAPPKVLMNLLIRTLCSI